MNSIQLAPDRRVEIVEIGHQMNEARLPKEFIANAVSVAFEIEGAYDLLKLWEAETEPAERAEIVADIQEIIDDFSQKDRIKGVPVRFDDLNTIAEDIRGFKDHLRAIVDNKGGVTRLAELTGIPQPSLSRFFNTATLPHRTTLYKIARALKLSEVEIATELGGRGNTELDWGHTRTTVGEGFGSYKSNERRRQGAKVISQIEMESVMRSILSNKKCFDSHDVINELLRCHGESYAEALEQRAEGPVEYTRLMIVEDPALRERILAQGRGAMRLNHWIACWIEKHKRVFHYEKVPGTHYSLDLWYQRQTSARWCKCNRT